MSFNNLLVNGLIYNGLLNWRIFFLSLNWPIYFPHMDSVCFSTSFFLVFFTSKSRIEPVDEYVGSHESR